MSENHVVLTLGQATLNLLEFRENCPTVFVDIFRTSCKNAIQAREGSVQMSQRRKAVCLIDDDEDEIRRFRECLGARFLIGAGTSIGSAVQELKKQGRSRPDIFLLDMYHPEAPPNVSDPQRRLNQARAKFLRAEAEFYRALAELRQTPEGGFRNLRDTRSQYRLPRVTVAFFTRKGTLDNAVRAYEDEIPCPVIKKPDLTAEQAGSISETDLSTVYDTAFRENSDQVAAAIERVIRRSSFWVRHGDLLIGTVIGAVIGYVTSVLSTLTFVWLRSH